MLSDILSVIFLCLIHALPFNAILVNICAICSNISGRGSWKDSKPWNLFFRLQAGLILRQDYISEKCHGNWNHLNQTQYFHLKQCISSGLGDWKPYPVQCTTIPLVGICICGVYMCCIYSICTFLYSIHTYLYNVFTYLFISNAITG